MKAAMLAALLALATAALPATAQDWALVGEARLNVLIWSVYDSRLYSVDGDYREGQRPLRLDIEYLRDIDAADLVERTASEWQRQQLAHPNQQPWLDSLQRLWPNVRDGDVLSVVVDAQDVSVFYLNGERLGEVSDPAFGTQFLAIWLSERTSHPDLRLALLGLD